MNDARQPLYRLIKAARGGKSLDRMETHALDNLLDAFGVPVERPEPKEWR